MGKERDTYRGFTTSALKARSAIPAQSNIAEHTGHIDCANISLSAVASLLGESFSLVDVCRSPSVNHWSGYGPTIRSCANPYGWSASLINSDPTVCSLGEFAGYDHTAQSPGWYNDPQGNSYWINSGNQAAINIDVVIGQVKYEDLGGVNVIGVLTDASDNVRGWGRVPLSGVGESASITINTDPDYYTLGITLDQTGMKIKVYIDNDYTISSATDVLNGLLCRVPNTDDAGVSIKIRPATTTYVDSAGFTINNPGWSNTPNPGRVGIGGGTYNGSYSEVRLYMSIYSYETNALVGSEILVNTYYGWTSMDDLFAQEAYPNGAWTIPDYGYLCIIRIEVSI